ncbi:hypothetical protein ACFL13_01780 [Patescibacteria group bacterium]
MPKFLYTILFLAFISWYAFISYTLGYSPDGLFRILTFLLLIFLSLSLTFSIPFYYLFHKRAPTFTNLKFLYRKGLRWGGFLSFGIVAILGFRAFDLFNPVNLGLFVLLYFLVFLQIKGKR